MPVLPKTVVSGLLSGVSLTNSRSMTFGAINIILIGSIRRAGTSFVIHKSSNAVANSLLSEYRGDYVAIWADETAEYVFVSPDSQNEIYWRRKDDRNTVISSSAIDISTLNTTIDTKIICAFATLTSAETTASAFSDVSRIPVGCLMIAKDSVEVSRVWPIFEPIQRLSVDDFIHHAQHFLACEIRAISASAGGRLGLLLSGGMDSSIIAYAIEVAGVEREKITAFTMYDPRYAAGDERVPAREVASLVGLKLREVSLAEFGAFSRNRTPKVAGSVPSRITLSSAYMSIDDELNGAPFLTGQGGDNIFHEILDVQKIAAMKLGLWNTVRAIVAHSGRYKVGLIRSALNVLRATWCGDRSPVPGTHAWIQSEAVNAVELDIKSASGRATRDLLYMQQLISANNSAYSSTEIAPLLTQGFVELTFCLDDSAHISDVKRPVERKLLTNMGQRHRLSAGKGFVTASVASSIIGSKNKLRDVLAHGQVNQLTKGGADFWAKAFDRLAAGDITATAPIAQALEAEFFMQQCSEALGKRRLAAAARNRVEGTAATALNQSEPIPKPELR
ncbi:asparagine synthase-related protein [Labrys sp. 22185]|uniref:asparagine synthase-related protein n=1 Tax=Labrys sp. 22185 TaxID=3453888 RepID=UPI003F83D790